MGERIDPSRVCVPAPALLQTNAQQMSIQNNIHQSPTLDGLPKQFVGALRTLFDILDEKAVGFVKFTDIENRWQDDGTKGLPKGVIESLRKVTPPNGLLSFERFCAGLKICLLRNQVESKKRMSRGGVRAGVEVEAVRHDPSARPPSAPLLDVEPKSSHGGGSWSGGGPGGGATRMAGSGQSMGGQQRTLSMPQLAAEPPPNSMNPLNLGIPVKAPLYGPPKPPRLLHSRTTLGLPQVDKSEIRSALQNWQIGMMLEEEKRSPGGYSAAVGYSAAAAQPQRPRSVGDGKPSGSGAAAMCEASPPLGNGGHKKTSGRNRREPRRHTLQNGIDYNMLKRMKQIELEKDVLVQGLEAVDRARDWYLKQIAAVQEKMKYLGRMGHTELWSEAQEERLELQRARVFEVNRHLATLTDPGERGGLPLHMNLAITPHSSQLIARLKQQNLLLTQDGNKKSDRITALEREKASLIRELYHTRSQGRPGLPVAPDQNNFL